MTTDDLAAAVGTEAGNELSNALARIKHCVDQLTDNQVWRRAQPHLNSIGNLILHLCGNVRQWIIAGVGGAADVRDRPAEFADEGVHHTTRATRPWVASPRCRASATRTG